MKVVSQIAGAFFGFLDALDDQTDQDQQNEFRLCGREAVSKKIRMGEPSIYDPLINHQFTIIDDHH